jgi:hypothetical protein
VEFGGGFCHNGLLIGANGFRPVGLVRWEYLNRWNDNVWYYDERIP